MVIVPKAWPTQRKRRGDCRHESTRLVEPAEIAQGRGGRPGKAGRRLARPLHRVRPAEKVGAKNAATFLETRGQEGDPERAVRWLEARPE